MRAKITSTIFAFLIAGPLFAQSTPRADPTLEQLLQGWEKTLAGLQSLSMTCERTTKDKVFETTERYRGTAKFLRPAQANLGIRASLELYRESNGKLMADRFEKYIITGAALYEYSPANKVIRKHVISAPQDAKKDDGVASFLFGNGAAELVARYRITLEPVKDDYYFLVKVEPKDSRDKADFTVAYVALYRSNLLTAMVQLRQANGTEVTWRFSNLQPNVKLTDADFAAPEPPPPGWQLERVPQLKTEGARTK